MPTTWNPSDKGTSITLSNGDLTATPATTIGAVRSTTSKTSGKRYFECVANWVTAESAGGDATIGIMTAAANINNDIGVPDVFGWGVFRSAGSSVFMLQNNSVNTNLGIDGADGDVLAVCLDLDNNKLYLTKNGTTLLGNPAALTGGQTIAAGAWFAAVAGFTNNSPTVYPMTANFGATAFAFAPPTGFTAWDTSSLNYKSFGASGVSFTRILKPVGT